MALRRRVATAAAFGIASTAMLTPSALASRHQGSVKHTSSTALNGFSVTGIRKTHSEFENRAADGYDFVDNDAQVRDALVGAATPDELTDIRTGSSNLLLKVWKACRNRTPCTGDGHLGALDAQADCGSADGIGNARGACGGSGSYSHSHRTP